MPAKITIRDNGSIRVEGEFEIYDSKGNKYDTSGRAHISLCRCGLSQTKPFCDHSHRDSDFKSECIAYALAPPTPKPT